MSFFQPDKFFERISHIDIDYDIVKKGFEYVLLDVDNTILTRDNSIVPKDVSRWIAEAKNKNIKFCLVSNDWHKNVLEVANDLDLPICVRALKPMPFSFLRAMKKIGAKRSKTLMIGDQLMTDVFGAHLVGITAYLLLPLVSCDLKHTLILRKVEKKFLRGKKPQTRRRNIPQPV